MNRTVICFDLDDTLYKEIDFVESAYKEIASSVERPELVSLMMQWYHEGKNVFEQLNSYLGLETPIVDYLHMYRRHIPAISLSQEVIGVLDELKHRGAVIGLITDGRSVSQRNKINILGLERWIEEKNVIISEESGAEKTDVRTFQYFMDLYPGCLYWYVGDNPQKDFVVPNLFHWHTVMLKDDGRNIHNQGLVSDEYRPKTTIASIGELLDLIG